MVQSFFLPREEDPEVQVLEEATANEDANDLSASTEASSSSLKRPNQSTKKQIDHITGSNKKAKSSMESVSATEVKIDNNGIGNNAISSSEGAFLGGGRTGRCVHCGYMNSKCRNKIHGDYAFVGGIVYLTDKIVEKGSCPPWDEVKSRFETKLSEMLNCETKLVTGKYDENLLPSVPTCIKTGKLLHLKTLFDKVHEVFNIRDTKSQSGATYERLRNARA